MTKERGEMRDILDNLCHNTMGNPPYRIDQTLQAIKKVVEGKKIEERLILLLCDFTVELWRKHLIGKIIEYDIRDRELWDKYAKRIKSDITKLFDRNICKEGR